MAGTSEPHGLTVEEIESALATVEHLADWHAEQARLHRRSATRHAGAGRQTESAQAWDRHAPHYAARAELRLAEGWLNEAVPTETAVEFAERYVSLDPEGMPPDEVAAIMDRAEERDAHRAGDDL